MFALNEKEEELFREYSEEIFGNEDFGMLKSFMAHGRITLYAHSVSVARLSLRLARRMDVDVRELVKGALLHDFYLYDWHDARIDVPLFKMHGFTHPRTACERAKERFEIDAKVENIIESHMWPLTLFTIPRSKEAWLVCLADKIAAAREIITR